MPEMTYFRQPRTQQLLVDILFVFCKLNADVGYRQGMHELLAPVLWVVEQDASDVEGEGGVESADGLLACLLDVRYIEHDAFTLFSLIMRTAKSFYELGEQEQKFGPAVGASSWPNAGSQSQSPIVERSRRIHEGYLAALDPALAHHLTEIEVLPQIFLMWVFDVTPDSD